MKLSMVTLAIAAPLLLCGCVQPKTPEQQAQDFSNAFACVRSDWGKPIPVIAGDCFQSLTTAAEDAVADVEAIVEGTAILAQQDVSKVQAAFPYSSDVRVVAELPAKRDAFVKGGAR